jgi:NADPH2:quinone reductase
MKAIRIHEAGGPEVLRLDEVPVPEPGPGEALVKIDAAGLNFVDIYERRGWYRLDLPLTLGKEAAGTVVSIGSGTQGVRPGDRVAFAMATGTYAEYAAVPAWKLAPIPDRIETKTAAAVMLQGMTAQYLARSTYPLGPGKTALVHAASGGVGQLLVQIAKLLGARVIGTCSTEEKAAIAKEAGADEVILYTRENFAERTLGLTGGAGVDVVYDSVGKDTFERGLECLKPRGYMVLYGQSSGPVPAFDPQTLNAKGSLFLTRPSLGAYTATRAEVLERSGELFSWILDRKLSVRIDREYRFQDAAEAQRYMEARKTLGKVLLVP